MRIHHLKTWPIGFRALKRGTKTYELRKDDRHFEVGDTLHLEEYDPEQPEFTGAELWFGVSYITKSGDFPGLEPGYCILGIQRTPAPTAPNYVTITSGLRGHFAVLVDGSDGEPIQTGVGSYKTAEAAVDEAVDWAREVGVPFRFEGYDETGKKVTAS
jgi:Domain of unknown function (DUF3850)